MQDGVIWLNLDKVNLHWQQKFLLELVEEELDTSQSLFKGVPDLVEAYSCDDPDTVLASHVSFFSVDNCD